MIKGHTPITLDFGTIADWFASAVSCGEGSNPAIMTDFSARSRDGTIGKGKVALGKIQTLGRSGRVISKDVGRTRHSRLLTTVR